MTVCLLVPLKMTLVSLLWASLAHYVSRNVGFHHKMMPCRSLRGNSGISFSPDSKKTQQQQQQQQLRLDL